MPAQFDEIEFSGTLPVFWRSALLPIGACMALSGCTTHEAESIAFEAGYWEVELAESETRRRILSCALDYMSHHGSEMAEIEYVSDGRVLHVRTVDSALQRNLEICAGRSAKQPFTGKLVIGNGLPGVRDVRL